MKEQRDKAARRTRDTLKKAIFAKSPQPLPPRVYEKLSGNRPAERLRGNRNQSLSLASRGGCRLLEADESIPKSNVM